MTLYDNERQDNPRPLPITLNTRVPSKWRFVDLETGEVWRWDQALGQFRQVRDLYDVARQVTEEVFGPGSWQDPRRPRPFEGVSEETVRKLKSVRGPHYDRIIIDEIQDFPEPDGG